MGHETDDALRRASDALIVAMAEGYTLRRVVELAMDDASAPDDVCDRLADLHDAIAGCEA